MYPIKRKADVFPIFKIFKARVELEFEKKIKCLRTDNGGEYTSISKDQENLLASVNKKVSKGSSQWRTLHNKME